LAPFLLAIVVIGALVLLASLLWGRRRKHEDDNDEDAAIAAAPPWVGDLRRRLEREGERRGTPRRTTETIASFARRLAASSLPDPRIATVGSVITAAIFGRDPIDPGTATWAASVVDEASAQPLPA